LAEQKPAEGKNMSANLYKRDFYAWTQEQAAKLRAGRLAELDISHLAEELESMGKKSIFWAAAAAIFCFIMSGMADYAIANPPYELNAGKGRLENDRLRLGGSLRCSRNDRLRLGACRSRTRLVVSEAERRCVPQHLRPVFSFL
jgi:hypothetical protein